MDKTLNNMNRTINFRGKRIDTGEWVYGDLIENQGRYYIYYATSDTTLENEDNSIIVLAEEVDPDTVGQYTGLKDRNGQDVYEGDLLRTPEGNIMITEWIGSGIVTRCLTPTYDGMMNTNRYAFPVSEKIGNIHDNPELLEDKK